jgi:hypothetical protein
MGGIVGSASGSNITIQNVEAGIDIWQLLTSSPTSYGYIGGIIGNAQTSITLTNVRHSGTLVNRSSSTGQTRNVGHIAGYLFGVTNKPTGGFDGTETSSGSGWYTYSTP